MRWSEEQYAAHLKQQRDDLTLERDFQRQVMQAADAAHWLAYHPVTSKKSRRGFPDTVLVKGTTVLFAELKMPWGRLSPDQRVWMDALQQVQAVEAYVWTPEDYETISARLFRQTR